MPDGVSDVVNSDHGAPGAGRREPEARARAVIVTVHGTNDADTADEGRRWWQQGSEFTRMLQARLTAHGLEQVEFLPFHWSGANSDHDRLRGAALLAKTLRRLAREGRPHAVIAHSHGGNVVQEALARTSGSAQRGGIVSFGTPFFIRQLKTVPFLIALFQILLGVLITPVAIWYLVEFLSAGTSKWLETLIFFGGLTVFCAWSLLSGLRKVLHRRLAERRLVRALGGEQWLVMYSPRDEAMRLLESAALISPQYVKTAAAVRALTAFASLAGVLVTIGAFTMFGSYFFRPLIDKVKAGQFGLGTAADLTFLLVVPVVYGLVFLAIAALARFGGGWLYARMLTSAIHGGVLGAAFGGDGPFKLRRVMPRPPYLASCKEHRIDALKFGGVDDAAVFDAARKLYDGIIAADGQEGGIGDPDLMWKRLSDALYHNAYMRDEEIADLVARHLMEHWPRAGR